MKYDTFLFDIDDTLLDFQSSAKKCLLETSAEFGLPTEEKYYYVYRDINQKYWDLYSENKIEKSKILKLRFVDYFAAIGSNANVDAFCAGYERRLAESAIKCEGTDEILAFLKDSGCRVYAVTNATAKIQRSKLGLSGIGKYFDGLFISEEIGHAKPGDDFFAKVKKGIPHFDKQRTLIVGDSVISDVALGAKNGVDTCLVRNADIPFSDKYEPTYTVDSLKELLDLLKNGPDL